LGEGKASLNKASAMQRTSSRIPQGRVERMGSLIGWSAPHGAVRPHAYSVTAGRDSSMLSIARETLAEILDRHPLDVHTFRAAVEHADKLLNPVKRNRCSDGACVAKKRSHSDPETCVVDPESGLRTDRRCSTTEMSQVMSKEARRGAGGGAGALGDMAGRRKSNGKNTSGRDSEPSSGRDSEEGLLEERLREAVESGWMRGVAAAHAATSLTQPGGPQPLNGLSTAINGCVSKELNDGGSHAASGLCLERSISILLDEVVALTTKVVSLQALVTNSNEGDATPRRRICGKQGEMTW
jgi:hypothetical protein